MAMGSPIILLPYILYMGSPIILLPFILHMTSPIILILYLLLLVCVRMCGPAQTLGCMIIETSISLIEIELSWIISYSYSN